MQDLDDLQPSEKRFVQPEGISNALTEKYLENVEFKKYVDVVWLTRKENKSVFDKQLQEQLRKDAEYYHNVLKRVIAAVKYLAIIGLAFRGTEEVFSSPHNEVLETNGLLLDNCRGQSFDNAANMSGVYNGVQVLLKEKNKFANYVPYAAHSLNLTRAELVKVATEIVTFFGLVPQMFSFLLRPIGGSF
ncbi:zinc finger MYM-type protein 1 [Trichonephila clavipes]|nr:zinc finger MYM-type protein 1 [Trichonephila clavipes]